MCIIVIKSYVFSQAQYGTKDTGSTRKAVCSLFLGGAAGSKYFSSEAALMIFTTMEDCSVQVFSSGTSVLELKEC